MWIFRAGPRPPSPVIAHSQIIRAIATQNTARVKMADFRCPAVFQNFKNRSLSCIKKKTLGPNIKSTKFHLASVKNLTFWALREEGKPPALTDTKLRIRFLKTAFWKIHLLNMGFIIILTNMTKFVMLEWSTIFTSGRAKALGLTWHKTLFLSQKLKKLQTIVCLRKTGGCSPRASTLLPGLWSINRTNYQCSDLTQDSKWVVPPETSHSGSIAPFTQNLWEKVFIDD